MSRTDDDLIMLGVPVEVEQGSVPGAVAILRAELRARAASLPKLVDAIRDHQRQLQAKEADRAICRDRCEELADAIAALERDADA